MDRKIRVGIIGAGWWAAHTHAPALKATGDVEIVAACRRSPERLKEFADLVGVPQTFTDHEEMLDRVQLDAVVVCSPHAMHAGHVKAALERGLPVLTDKPLSITVAEGEELIALAAAKNVPLAVFFGHCYDAAHRYVGRAIREGRLGRLVDVSQTGYANPDALGFFGNAEFKPNPEEFPILPTQFRADPALGGGGYLQDVGNHLLSGMLIGTGLRVAEVSALMDDPERDLRAVLTFRFTNGAFGTLTVFGDLCPPVENYFGTGRFAYTGDLGTLWRDNGSPHLRFQRWREEPIEIGADELPTPTNPDENFIRTLQGRAELIAPASEAIECVRAASAAYESARTGCKVVIRAVEK
ncbi:MAG: putative dehydrogenase [Chthonomonadaceae bacterium]|nr:putative dehydrogenase [Chthonomonadaceae bacterium]